MHTIESVSPHWNEKGGSGAYKSLLPARDTISSLYRRYDYCCGARHSALHVAGYLIPLIASPSLQITLHWLSLLRDRHAGSQRVSTRGSSFRCPSPATRCQVLNTLAVYKNLATKWSSFPNAPQRISSYRWTEAPFAATYQDRLLGRFLQRQVTLNEI